MTQRWKEIRRKSNWNEFDVELVMKKQLRSKTTMNLKLYGTSINAKQIDSKSAKMICKIQTPNRNVENSPGIHLRSFVNPNGGD